ncbi:hypothetical protein AARAC_005978 [Aspergillus arachidicola]|uniref:Uncharacterized protein n=1 Tax=Aspergillus arachidicola TaxID=656916 RepID=A0A2G7FVZ5_9EURO|nr:hypothetical protein AARAC_005978 [Aspergillus arachidicola]
MRRVSVYEHLAQLDGECHIARPVRKLHRITRRSTLAGSIVQGANWELVGKIANGTSGLVDRAKRDRMVWPGDVVISAPSVFASTNSLNGLLNRDHR